MPAIIGFLVNRLTLADSDPASYRYLTQLLCLFSKVSGVGYNVDGEITTEETYLDQGRLVNREVIVDPSNHPGIRKIIEVGSGNVNKKLNYP